MLTSYKGTSGRGDKGGVWTAEGEDCGCGGEVRGAAGGFLALFLVDYAVLLFWGVRLRGEGEGGDGGEGEECVLCFFRGLKLMKAC